MTLSTTKNIYDVQVESVKPCEDDENKVVVVLSCDRLDEALVESRVQSAELIFDEYQGLKVPRSAIRFQGDQKGVYVILGKDVTFNKDQCYLREAMIMCSLKIPQTRIICCFTIKFC